MMGLATVIAILPRGTPEDGAPVPATLGAERDCGFGTLGLKFTRPIFVDVKNQIMNAPTS